MELVTKKGVATYDRRGLVRSNIQTNIKEEVQVRVCSIWNGAH